MTKTQLELPGEGPSRQSDQAFDRVKGEIVLCRLAPGLRFSEAELSERFGIARAAMRAALMRLAEVGLVQPVPRHGFVVAPITVASVRDLFEMRLIAEPKAAALATGKVDVERLRRINRRPQLAKSAAQRLAFVESNRAFHREIAKATGNARLYHLLESLADEMQRLVHVGLFGPDVPGARGAEKARAADAQHEALIAAFESGDAGAAERAARLHIEHARQLVMSQIAGGTKALALS